jgi:hypothetical protein
MVGVGKGLSVQVVTGAVVDEVVDTVVVVAVVVEAVEVVTVVASVVELVAVDESVVVMSVEVDADDVEVSVVVEVSETAVLVVVEVSETFVFVVEVSGDGLNVTVVDVTGEVDVIDVDVVNGGNTHDGTANGPSGIIPGQLSPVQGNNDDAGGIECSRMQVSRSGSSLGLPLKFPQTPET